MGSVGEFAGNPRIPFDRFVILASELLGKSQLQHGVGGVSRVAEVGYELLQVGQPFFLDFREVRVRLIETPPVIGRQETELDIGDDVRSSLFGFQTLAQARPDAGCRPDKLALGPLR